MSKLLAVLFGSALLIGSAGSVCAQEGEEENIGQALANVAVQAVRDDCPCPEAQHTEKDEANFDRCLKKGSAGATKAFATAAKFVGARGLRGLIAAGVAEYVQECRESWDQNEDEGPPDGGAEDPA
jgi:hypothetical protein